MTVAVPREIKPQQKAYAFERSLGIPPAEACRRVGGKVANGHATKWEANARVQAWIGYYRSLGQTDEMMAAKRARIEDELFAIGMSNMDDFIALVETQSGAKAVLPVLDLKRINAMTEAERRTTLAAVKSVKYTENGPTFELHGKLEALAQLRDMHGFKAPAKTELTGKNGGPVETVSYSDEERAKALIALLAKVGAAPQAGV